MPSQEAGRWEGSEKIPGAQLRSNGVLDEGGCHGDEERRMKKGASFGLML